MSNNSLGGLRGKLTRNFNIELNLIREEERSKKKKEIIRNKDRWVRAINKLKRTDINFDDWYDSSEIPEYIKWSGKDFEKIIRILRKRLKYIKTEKQNG